MHTEAVVGLPGVHVQPAATDVHPGLQPLPFASPSSQVSVPTTLPSPHFGTQTVGVPEQM